VGEAREVDLGAHVVTGVAGIYGRAPRPALARVGIVRARTVRARRVHALAILDHVRGVVGDDVEIDLHAALVHSLDEGAHVGLGAEMRIDAGEVGDPVTVVAGGLLARPALHRLVLVDRPQPDGRGA